MNDMSDDHLKEVFGKLKNFESEEKGAAWHPISKQLPKLSPKVRMTRYASVLTILSASLLLVMVNEQNVEDQQVQALASQNKFNTAPVAASVVGAHQGEEKTMIFKSGQSNGNREKSSRYSAHEGGEKSISEVKSIHGSTQNISSKEHSRIDGLTNRPIKIASKLEKPEEPSLEIEDEKPSEEKPIIVSISPGYLFGVVDPLPNDPFLIHNYNSRPGFGLKLEATKEIQLFRNIRVHTGPSFSYLKKSFDFSITQFNPESTTERALRESYGSPYVGWNFYFESQNYSSWTAGLGINKNLGKNKSLNRFVGDTFLSIGITRAINENKEAPFIFKPGLSFSLPLTGKIEYLRYYPIQLTLTIQHAFSKKTKTRSLSPSPNR